MNKIKRIYVAGPYSSDNVIDILNNMCRGMRLATEVLLAGFYPFAPWLDYQFSLMLQDDESLTIDDYYKYSIAWLEVSDAILVTQNYEKSNGTLKEIEKARELNIPIFYSLGELKRHDKNKLSE